MGKVYLKHVHADISLMNCTIVSSFSTCVYTCMLKLNYTSLFSSISVAVFFSCDLKHLNLYTGTKSIFNTIDAHPSEKNSCGASIHVYFPSFVFFFLTTSRSLDTRCFHSSLSTPSLPLLPSM